MKSIHTYDQFSRIAEQQLFEDLRSQNLEALQDLIVNKITCTVDYRGEFPSDILNGLRVIEPYTAGVNDKGITYVRAWLIRGISKSGRVDPSVVPGWRLFRVDRIKSITPTGQKFTVPRKGYNDQDSAMSEILFTAAF